MILNPPTTSSVFRMAQSPAALGRILCQNAFNKHGSNFADPLSLLDSDSFECFCSGRGFDSVDRKECESEYRKTWKELIREN